MPYTKRTIGRLPVSRGNWDPAEDYFKYNIVTRGGSSFMSITDNTMTGSNYEPSVSIVNGQFQIKYGNTIQDGTNDKWQLLAYGSDADSIRTGYLECSSNADEDKVISAPWFALDTSIRLIIKMANANTKANPTLSINGSEAKYIYYNGAKASSTNTWRSGELLDVFYDGQYYYLTDYNFEAKTGYVTCGIAAGTAAKTVTDLSTLSGFVLDKGIRLLIKFTYANTAENPTLSINGTDPKSIYYNGALVTNTYSWTAGEVLDVYYDGTNYVATTYGGAQFSTGQKVGDVGIDNEPTAGSDNLVKSRGVKLSNIKTDIKIKSLADVISFIKNIVEDGFYLTDNSGNVGLKLVNGILDTIDIGSNIRSKIDSIVRSIVNPQTVAQAIERLSELESEVIELSAELGEQEEANWINAYTVKYTENGFYLTDFNGNIGLSFIGGVIDIIDFGTNATAKINALIDSKKAPIEANITDILTEINALNGKTAFIYPVTEDGIYIIDKDGNIGASFKNNELDAIQLSSRLLKGGNNNEADLKESLTINKVYSELKELKDKTEESISSLQSIQKSGEHFSSTFTIPSANVDRQNVVVRVGVHKGNNLEGRESIFNEVFFSGDCENDFSDIRFLDDSKILNTRKLHSGNYEVYRDHNFAPGHRITCDSNGYIYALRNSELYRSTDGGQTFVKVTNSVADISEIMGVDSRNYLYLNRIETNSTAFNYRSSVYVYVLDLNNSFDLNDAYLICDMSFAGWQNTEDNYGDPMASKCGIAELDGYIFFGRYQVDHNSIIYRSINNTMTPVNGEYTKIIYEQSHLNYRDQHVHNLYACATTHQIFANLDNSNPRPCNLYSNDYGETWVEWSHSIDEDVWKRQRGIDYIPSYISSDASWMIGGGEVAILGGASILKIHNRIENDFAVPYHAERKVLTAQGSRHASAFSDNFVVTGLNAGSGESSEAHILLVTNNGEDYKTIYSQLGNAPTTNAGTGVRFFSKPFVPATESESVIYVDGLGTDVDVLRIVQGGSHYYGEILVEVGDIPANVSKTITVKSGYMACQPNIQVLKRDLVEPIYQLPLNEGNGMYVSDSNGNKHTIVGNYEWSEYENNVRFGSTWPLQKPYNTCNGLRLYGDAHIDLGQIPQLDFNKGFTITFWAKYDTGDSINRQVLFSNTELSAFVNQQGRIYFGGAGNMAYIKEAVAPACWDVWVPFALVVSNDTIPTIAFNRGESELKAQFAGMTTWDYSNFSELNLRIGCQNYSEGVEECFPYYLTDIKIYDRPFTWQELANMYNGRYRTKNI